MVLVGETNDASQFSLNTHTVPCAFSPYKGKEGTNQSWKRLFQKPKVKEKDTTPDGNGGKWKWVMEQWQLNWLIRYHYSTYCGLNLSKHSLMVGSSVLMDRLVGKKHIYLADSRTLEAFTFNQEHGFQDLIVTIELQIPYSIFFSSFFFCFLFK